jgi:hypothetical protein
MAMFEEQITDTLETGAPPIKYEGDEGPQDPRQERMITQLKEEYMQYVFEMKELQEPIMSFEEWYQMTYKASQMGAQAPQEEMMSEEMMMREPAAYGGIMDLDSGRRAYGLGSFFKKITKPIKKIGSKLVGGAKKLIKSPVGKMGIAALLAGPALGALSGSGAASSGFLSSGAAGGASLASKAATKKTMGTLLKEAAKKAISNPKTLAKIGIGAASALPLLGIGTTAKEDYIADSNKGPKFDYDYNKMRDRFAKAETEADFAAAEEEFPVTPGLFASRFYDMKADGGRIGFALGSKADFAIEDVMTGGVEDEIGGITGIMRQADLQRKGNVGQFYAADGGSPKEGGIIDLGGMEKDYRETGGFVDLGAEEKADDVPARLSVNEFVMTADAVRGAGDGDIDLGAERMEDVMKQLEQKGQQFAGGGERGWKAQMLAEDLAQERYGMEFYDLSQDKQFKIYNIALDMIDSGGEANKGAADMFEVSERLSEVV